MNIVCGLASPVNAVGHADSEQQRDSAIGKAEKMRERTTVTVLGEGRVSSGHVLNIFSPLRECLECAFPLFLQLWSLVESLSCSSKAEM